VKKNLTLQEYDQRRKMLIEQLHQLNKEITDLECKYDEALNWLFTTRKELITVLSALNRGILLKSNSLILMMSFGSLINF
jgi:hypothetical protein